MTLEVLGNWKVAGAHTVARAFTLSLHFFGRQEMAAAKSILLRLIIVFLLLTLASSLVFAQNIQVSVDASRTGPKIDRNLFGQFAEHLGYGIYGGIWVGPDSPIPNTRGIRNDVVAALKAIHVPNVRWPGGCFADEYHWRDGIGPQRAVRLNPNWGGVIEPNTFGTH